jgi:NADH:ubiquinone oxidoreductase subunit 4 (subunit M)
MSWLDLVVAACLIPVFPFSLVFNLAVSRVPTYWGQAAAVVALPAVGTCVLVVEPHKAMSLADNRAWVALVVLTAILYGFRAISVRDAAVWARLMATSGLALDWLLVSNPGWSYLLATTLAWTLPAALLMVLAGLLARRTGGAYLGLQGGLASALPRISGLLTLSALALAATPIFPGFFALLGIFSLLSMVRVVPLMLLLLVWGWSLGNFLQNLLFGKYSGDRVPDIGLLGTSSTAVLLLVFVLAGVFWSGHWIGI